MLTANVKNMFVTSIGTTMETGVVLTQYIVIIWTVRRQLDSDNRKLVSSVRSTFVQLLISAWSFSRKRTKWASQPYAYPIYSESIVHIHIYLHEAMN